MSYMAAEIDRIDANPPLFQSLSNVPAIIAVIVSLNVRIRVDRQSIRCEIASLIPRYFYAVPSIEVRRNSIQKDLWTHHKQSRSRRRERNVEMQDVLSQPDKFHVVTMGLQVRFEPAVAGLA